MQTEALYPLFLQSSGITTDTRNISKNQLFFALKGTHFNGNKFAQQALEQGALYAIVDEAPPEPHPNILQVKNVLTSLQQLARYHRNQFNIPVIGITGSNGKTTTKELIARVLSTRYKVHFTQGNFNNHIGVPLTLLAMPPQTEMAVIEMGANHIGEIAALCNIANPNYGLITNIGKAHLEGFGGIEGVLRGKTELYQHIKAHGKNVFINSTDTVLANMAKRFSHPILYPGKHDFVHLEYRQANPFVAFSYQSRNYTTHLTGNYNFANLAAALAIGLFFKVPASKALHAVCTYTPGNNRSQIVKTKNNTLILDAYNANPDSMKVAIENFASMDYAKKMVILGDMLELGNETPKEHAALGKLVCSKGFDGVFYCGKASKEAAKKCIGSLYFATKEELAQYLQKHPITKATVLMKASRGIGLETLVDYL